ARMTRQVWLHASALALALATAASLDLRVAAQFGGGGGRPPDIAGEWRRDSAEDPGQPPGADYLGLALNEAGRLRADSTPESYWGTPEYQCRPHWRRTSGGASAVRASSRNSIRFRATSSASACSSCGRSIARS